MPGLPWSKFFWRDYEADEAVKQCSFAAQGLWMRMLCLCAKGDPYGYLSIAGEALDVAGVSTAVGKPETEIAPLIAELDRWGVFSRDRKGRIYNRRMVKAEQLSNEGRKHARRRWVQVSETEHEKSRPNGVAYGPPMTQKPESREVEASKPVPRQQTSHTNARPSASVIDLEFEVFWRETPRKSGRGQAQRAYRTARKTADAETLLAGIKRYAELRRGQEERYTKHPATWLNGECWLDEAPPTEPKRWTIGIG